MRWIFAVVFTCVAQVSNAQTLKIAVFTDHISTISNQALQECPSLSDADIGENQMLAEYVIFCNALKLANYSKKIKLVPFPISIRALDAVHDGEVDATGFGVWGNEASKVNVTLSNTLLAKSEFSKGLYTRKDLSQKISKIELYKPAELIAVANQNWDNDWKALKCTGLNILHVDQYRQMFNLVELGRADVFPLTFSAKADLQRSVFGISLFPIKGIKISIDDSLHFALSNRFDHSNELKYALNKGMKLLQQDGQISKVYQTLGITNPAVKSWLEIGC